MNTQNLTCKRKVLNPSSKRSTVNIVSKTHKPGVCTHIPTLRCHEEAMSKLSSYGNDCVCERDVGCCLESYHDKKEKKDRKRKGGHANTKLHNLKFKEGHQSGSVLLDRDENKFPQNVKSKSVPLVQKHNFEDSVDFIPVKLASNNDCREKQKQLSQRNVKGASRSGRPTWDQLLKGEVPMYKPSSRSLSSGKHNENVQSDESLPNTPKKKVSIKSYAQDKSNIECLQKREDFPKTDELLFDPLISDPVKSLDILIKQLRERITKQPENDNLQKIILDMENALLKISVENQVYSKIVQGKNLHNGVCSSADSKSALSDGSNGKFQSRNGNLNVAQLQKGLEESCLFLQSLCIKQRESCNNHMREKEQLTLQLAESRRLLTIAKSKEKDYEVSIGELRLQIQEASSKKDQKSQSEKELLGTVEKLQAEIETLKSLKEAVTRLKTRLKETAREKEILRSKLYLKELEIEKLKVLLEVKENLNPALTRNESLNEFMLQRNGENVNLAVEEKNTSLLSLSTVTSWTQDRPGIMCSSQASSSPRRSPSPYNSWQHISSIYQKPNAASALNKDIANIFKDLKLQTEQNNPPQLDLEIPSSVSSFWSDDKEDLEVSSKIVFSGCGSGTLSS